MNELCSLGLNALRSGLARGEFSAVDLTTACLDRIERLDAVVNAVIRINPDALDRAAALDRRATASRPPGPLHGIPILLKDNIDTGDRMPTTAGSVALKTSIAPDDAFVVKQLRRAGAIVLGKTNLSEWANFRSTRSSTGWSSLGGQTVNAFDMTRSPGGSSSGSGVAVAMGMAPASLGTETDGSVVIPAAMNSLVGIKPTLGLVSRSGIIPIAHSQDTAGPIARTVTDAALLLDVMLGEDASDPASRPSGDIRRGLAELDAGALKGKRIGIDRTLCDDLPAGVSGILEESIAVLKSCGARVIDDRVLEAHHTLDADEQIVLCYEFKDGLNRYLQSLGPSAPLRSLSALIEFNSAHADTVMPHFGQEHFHAAQASGSLTDPRYVRARDRANATAGRDGIDATLEKYRLDALFGATIGPPWEIDWVTGDRRSACISSPAAVAGYPHVTVPAGFLHGLPIGVSFYAGAFSDARILGFAYAFEQAAEARRAPPDLP